MGNCLRHPADNHSPIATKPSTPVNNKESTIKQRKTNNNAIGAENRGSAEEEVPTIGKIITPNLKTFSFAELKSATRNFRPDKAVGERGFGSVFKGWVDKETYAPSKAGVGMIVAVKKHNPDGGQGLQEWEAEVNFLRKFSHPNLVKLLGYCWEENLFFLVYEYMEGGSVEDHLFAKGGGPPISWDTRLKIAIGAARGLVFLHTTEKQVIYREFKASNILLDKDFNAKLEDFGLAKLGPVDYDSHITPCIIGTYGYVAPEYVATGHLYEPISKLKNLMDPRLENQYPQKAAFQATQLILKCLELKARYRPSMDEVLVTLHQINSIKMNPNESKETGKQTAAHRPP